MEDQKSVKQSKEAIVRQELSKNIINLDKIKKKLESIENNLKTFLKVG